jgi:hypothetical protein
VKFIKAIEEPTMRCSDFDVSSPISATMISVRDSFVVLRRVTASCVNVGRTKARPSEAYTAVSRFGRSKISSSSAHAASRTINGITHSQSSFSSKTESQCLALSGIGLIHRCRQPRCAQNAIASFQFVELASGVDLEDGNAGIVSEEKQVWIAKAGTDDLELLFRDFIDRGDDLFQAEI